MSAALRGVERVTALLYMMDREAAGRIIATLAPDDLRRVTEAAATLPPVASGQIASIVQDLRDDMGLGRDLAGSRDGARALLQAAVDAARIDDVMAQAMGEPRQSIWNRFADAPDKPVLALLRREHPQVAAYAIARLPAERAAVVLFALEASLRETIVRRMAGLRSPAPSIARLLEAVIEGDVAASAMADGTAGPEAVLIDLVARLDSEQAGELVSTLREARPQIAAKLKDAVFDFADIARQGYLEASNVDPVREITELISAQRAYEMNSKVVQAADDMSATLTKALR